MLKTYEAIYDHGKLEWVGEALPDSRVKILVVAEQPDAPPATIATKIRTPPPELKGSISWLGNALKPLSCPLDGRVKKRTIAPSPST